MQLEENYKNVICIYKITCTVNGKILIGSTTNLYNRVNHYRNDLHKSNPLKYYNHYFYNDLIKYGIDKFNVDIVEIFEDISNIELKNKETYYMNLYNSLDRNIGYNIRQDVDGQCICSKETKELKRKQTIEHWELGLHNNHSNKMKDYWKNNNDRRIQQSIIMSNCKTKYVYSIYNIETKEEKHNISYKDLYIPGYTNYKIALKFCYVNKKANDKKQNKSPLALKVIINEITIEKYIVRRTKI